MIKVINLSKSFIKNLGKKQEYFYAVKDISFEVKDGMIFGVLGQNGAGKTTLLRMLCGIMTPLKGKVLYDDISILENEDKIKKDIAFLSGNTKLYENITPRELLNIFANVYELDKNTVKNRINDVIKLLKMENFCDNKINNLSTGQIQRVNIARCFIHDPKYYIFDEATAGLDVMSSQIIIDFMKEERKRGKTIIYSTHYMEEAENICDRVLIINHGKAILEDTPKNIIKNTKTHNLRDAFFKVLGDNDEI